MFAGTVSAQVCGLITVPVDRVKILLQTGKYYKGPRDLYKKERYRIVPFLFKSGLTPTMIRESLFGVTYFPLFQGSKMLVDKSGIFGSHKFSELAFCGGLTWRLVLVGDLPCGRDQEQDPK